MEIDFRKLVNINSISIKFLESELIRTTPEDYINFNLSLLDVSKPLTSDTAPINITGAKNCIYENTVSEIVWIIENYITDEAKQEYLYNKLVEIHNRNVEFVNNNPNNSKNVVKAKTKTKEEKKNKKSSKEIPVGKFLFNSLNLPKL